MSTVPKMYLEFGKFGHAKNLDKSVRPKVITRILDIFLTISEKKSQIINKC